MQGAEHQRQIKAAGSFPPPESLQASSTSSLSEQDLQQVPTKPHCCCPLVPQHLALGDLVSALRREVLWRAQQRARGEEARVPLACLQQERHPEAPGRLT